MECFYFVKIWCSFYGCKVNGCQSETQLTLSNLPSKQGVYWHLGDASPVLTPWHQHNSLWGSLSCLSYLSGQQTTNEILWEVGCAVLLFVVVAAGSIPFPCPGQSWEMSQGSPSPCPSRGNETPRKPRVQGCPLPLSAVPQGHHSPNSLKCWKFAAVGAAGSWSQGSLLMELLG